LGPTGSRVTVPGSGGTKSAIFSSRAGSPPACRSWSRRAAQRGGARDHTELLDELLALPQIAVDAQVEERAIDAQRQLARVGRHRLPPVDLIVAAVADVNRLGILHYDSDYDLLTEKTDLPFRKRLARRPRLAVNA
jgi:predicted nucleic acid-binding protein